MLTKVEAGPYPLPGISVGSGYTSLQVPELDAALSKEQSATPSTQAVGPRKDHLSERHCP
jgi:hypothetical protein